MRKAPAQRYAHGKFAKAMCQRSGLEARYGQLVRDGYDKNLMVLPEFYDPPHPAERIVPVSDAVLLRNPTPDLDRPGITITLPTLNPDTWQPEPSLTIRLEVESPGVSFSLSFLTDDEGNFLTDEDGNYLLA